MHYLCYFFCLCMQSSIHLSYFFCIYLFYSWMNDTEIAKIAVKFIYGGQRPNFTTMKLNELTNLLFSTSFEAGQKWTIAVVFCQLMSIPWTTAFLETCARADKWLAFLWFAQLHQYSKQQVIILLRFLLMYRVYTLISRYILHGVREMNILKKPLDCCGYTCMSNKQILGLLLESMYMSIKRLSKNVFKV